MITVYLAETIIVCLVFVLLKIITSVAGAATHETSSELLLFTTQDIKVTLSSVNIICCGDLGEIANHLWGSSCCGSRSFQQRGRENS